MTENTNTEAHTEHTKEEKTSAACNSMSCPEVCRKYPHAFIAGAIILAFILGMLVNGGGHGGDRRGHKGGDWEKKGRMEQMEKMEKQPMGSETDIAPVPPTDVAPLPEVLPQVPETPAPTGTGN